jgi:hypothetical protein
MFRKDLLKDWHVPHFLWCGWYIDYSKYNTPTMEIPLKTISSLFSWRFLQVLHEHRLRVGSGKWLPREKESWRRKWPNLLPLMLLLKLLWLRLCKQQTMWGKKKRLLPHLFFPPFLLVESKALDRDHSSFLHPTQVRLLLPLIMLLVFTTWFSHSLGIPLWQPRSHPEPGPLLYETMSKYIHKVCLHYIFFPFTT